MQFKRRLGYLNGFLGQFMREIRLRMPGSVFLGPVFALRLKARYGSQTASKKIMTTRERPQILLGPATNRLVLGIPKLETRGDKWVEGDHFFVMSHQENISDLLSFESILVLSGSPFSHLAPGFRDLYQDHISNPNKRVILIHGDIRFTKPGELENWIEKVDVVVHFNPLYAAKVHNNKPPFIGKTLIWPSLPFPETFFDDIVRENKKENAVVFTGADHRSRKSYFQYCERKGISAIDLSHGRGRGSNTQVDYRSYLERLASFQLAFTNGYKNRGESIVVGRAFESILLKTTLLYESGSWINHFLTPYEHYIPVYNHADLGVKSNYLLKNIDISRNIAEQAYNHVISNYSTRKFWSSINELLLHSRVNAQLDKK